MIQFYSPEHALYKLVRAEKRGATVQPMVLEEIKAWMYKKWGIRVVYIYIEESAPAVMHLILDAGKDYHKWWRVQRGSLFRAAGDRLLEQKYKELLRREGDTATLTQISGKKLAVPSYSFASIAMMEVLDNIPAELKQHLREKYATPDVWELKYYYNRVDIFFYTEQQKVANTGKQAYDLLLKAYYDLLKPYDEFDYYKWDEMKVHLDSKEYFDDHYKGIWYNYYK